MNIPGLFRRNSVLFLAAFAFLSTSLLIPQISLSQTSNSYLQTLARGDRLWISGDFTEAEKVYRQVKKPFKIDKSESSVNVITDPTKLSGAAKVYYREAKRGLDKNLRDATLIPLKALVEKQPNFLPGHVLRIEAMRKFGPEDEVLPAIEAAAAQFPDSLDLIKLQISALVDKNKYFEASLAARKFALFNDKHPEAPKFEKKAERYFDKFRGQLKQDLILSGLASLAANVVTGNGQNQTVALASLVLEGESGMGSRMTQDILSSHTLIQDPEILGYVNRVGQSLVDLMGRNDFDYEFFVINDDSFRAFAAPGGKIFVHTGALKILNTEAELAGLLSHEIAHAVLSHGYQKLVRQHLVGSLGQILPLGRITGLIVLDHSRETEREADLLATRTLSAAGYASDGLHRMFENYHAINKEGAPGYQEYLSTHPLTSKRIRYMEQIIQQNGYNRYAFEGVEEYSAFKQKL